MESDKLDQYYEKFKYGEDNFHNLMQFRIRKILLVSTVYDAYILEHDSILSEQIVVEYHQLNLTTIPRIIHISTGEEAVKLIEKEDFDLVITTMHIGVMNPFDLAENIKIKRPELMVLLLLTVQTDCLLLEREDIQASYLDKVFLWNGDSGIFLAMIKYAEDKINAAQDTVAGSVKIIVFIEDSISFYSAYLPFLYKEIMEQTQRLISEECNDVNKYFRMKSRPKVLLTSDYEEALRICKTYQDSLIGVISDMEFPIDGDIDRDGGLKFYKALMDKGEFVPFLFQSSDMKRQIDSSDLKVPFIYKESAGIKDEVRNFILRDLGFGDFIFRDNDGHEIDRAYSISDFERVLMNIPTDSLLYHGRRNQFSAWLSAHGEFQVARQIKNVKVDDFDESDEIRSYLKSQFTKAKHIKTRGQIISFDPGLTDLSNAIIRIGSGSLGGKGRGLAFFNALLTGILADSESSTDFKIPKTLIIGTSEFDQFLKENDLNFSQLIGRSDLEIKEAFISGILSAGLIRKLKELLRSWKFPIAVRSSGLLEDSQAQPFAGIYHSYMLPNNKGSLSERINVLSDAIRLVYASVFLNQSRKYIEGMNFNVEDEKMAVIIQEIVGSSYERRFYPQISGTAQSFNFYPVSHMNPHDGSAQLALGFGHTIARGGRAFLFCPAWPSIPFVSERELIQKGQKDFFSLDLTSDGKQLLNGEETTLEKNNIDSADDDGTLRHLISRVDMQTGALKDDYKYMGPAVLSFRDIVQYNYFPLPGILDNLLKMGEKSFGAPVEIEFAIDSLREENPQFYLLQIRPMTVFNDLLPTDSIDIEEDKILIRAENTLGHGYIDSIVDILLVDPERFDSSLTEQICRDVAQFNDGMAVNKKEYILIGPGRWGSEDHNLGIPVRWDQINLCRVIVENGLKDFDIDPSMGSHFFHNIMARNVGYMNIPFYGGNSFIRWDLLKDMKQRRIGDFLIHFESESPFIVNLDGRKRISLITKI